MHSRGIWRPFAVLSAALVLCLTGSSARAELLINGDFENQPNFAPASSSWVALTGNQIPGWTIAQDHYATVHRAGAEQTIAGKYSVNTDGEGRNGNNIYMYQDFGSSLGDSLQLSFQWMGWQRDNNIQLNISLTDLSTSATLFNGLYTSDGLLQAHTVTADFLGTGSLIRLLVRETPQSGRNDNLFLVDNFSVVMTQAAVPEPAGLVLLGIGALAAAGVSTKFHKGRRTADA